MAKKKAARRQAPKRTTSKVSAVKGKSVEWYISTLDDWRGDVVRQLDELVRKVVPAVTASIKWAQPVYESNGPFCFVKAAKNHVTIGFWRGIDVDDPNQLFEGTGDKMRHVKIKDAKSLPAAALRKMIKQAVALNHDLGNPTK